MIEFAAEAASSGYGPNIVGAIIGGVFTGVSAALVAFFTARHEVREADKRRWLEQRDRKVQEETERTESQARDEEARRDALRRSVVASFVEACGSLQAAIQVGEPKDIIGQMVWAGSRATQLRMMLHGEGRDDVLDWFDARWQRSFVALTKALPGDRGIRMGQPANREKLQVAHRDFMNMEYVCARWEVQPISAWTTEEPPEWLSNSTGRRPDASPQDRAE